MRITWKKIPITDCMVLAGINHHSANACITDTYFLRVGDVIKDDFCSLQIARKNFSCSKDGLLHPEWVCRVLEGIPALGERSCIQSREGFSLAWITLSDKGARGEREDVSGPVIRDTVAGTMNLCLKQGIIIPDEPDVLKHVLVDLCLQQQFDLVLTTGGTGVGPRDITPEVTLSVLDKRLPGFEQAMMAAALEKTPHAVISRAVAGTMGSSLIINLPGSPKAVRENLLSVLPALKHTVEKLQGDAKDCGHLS